MNNNLLLVILGVSLILNAFFFILDVYPFRGVVGFRKRFYRYFKPSVPNDEYIDAVVKRAMVLAKNPKGVQIKCLESNNIIARATHALEYNNFTSHFSRFAYHRSYLFGGLISYLVKNNDPRISYVEQLFDKYLDEDGVPKFPVDTTDQAVFGVAAIDLFEHTKNPKHKMCAQKIYDFLVGYKDDNNIIQYRKNDYQYVDAMGMVVPFLIRYGIAFDNKEALTIAYENMNFYIKHGLDDTSRLPFHAFNIRSLIKTGPTNWGRGIGWYMLGLYHIIKYTDANNNPCYAEHKSEYDAMKAILKRECTKELWGQFLGMGGYPDSSCSVVFLYTIDDYHTDDEVNKNLDKLKPLTQTNGMIDFTTGETIFANYYSHSYSCSEFSQGILLYWLSERRAGGIDNANT